MNLPFFFEIIEVPHRASLCRKWQEISEVEEKHDRVLR